MELKNMKFTKKRELIIKNEKCHIGYSLCSTYGKNIKDGTIKLENFGYCPSLKEFYYNNNIHLPKEIIKYFSNAVYNQTNIDKMEELGIHNSVDLNSLINAYEEAKKEVDNSKIEMEIEKQKVLNFRRELKKRKTETKM